MLDPLTITCVPVAGMEEGSICCWDLSEPDKSHSAALPATGPQLQQLQEQEQEQHSLRTPARRPSYTTAVPISTGSSSHDSYDPLTDNSKRRADVLNGALHEHEFAAEGVVAVAAVPTAASSGGGAVGSSSGGAVCRLVVLSSGCCVTLYSVMLRDTGSSVAVNDLGMRTGERGMAPASTQTAVVATALCNCWRTTSCLHHAAVGCLPLAAAPVPGQLPQCQAGSPDGVKIIPTA